MVPWFALLISEIRFRKVHAKEMANHPFKMPLAPVSNYLTIGFLFVVLVGMWFNDDTRISLIVGVVFLMVMSIFFFAFGMNKRDVKISNHN